MQCSASFISCYVCPLCTNAGPRRLKRKWSRARHQGQGRAARARLARGYWHQAAKRAWIQPMPDFGIRRERSKRMRLSKAPRHRRGPAFPSPLGRAATRRATASEAHRAALCFFRSAAKSLLRRHRRLRPTHGFFLRDRRRPRPTTPVPLVHVPIPPCSARSG